ncbi:peptidase [Brevibacillus dissolubilis]|uniref:peptidase n=1 Tax=Brevibacillus dissolubilis TaxID=1844116 RepID=UPI0011169873|nr:peptidase [Brevibacillus dissolubilis]
MFKKLFLATLLFASTAVSGISVASASAKPLNKEIDVTSIDLSKTKAKWAEEKSGKLTLPDGQAVDPAEFSTKKVKKPKASDADYITIDADDNNTPAMATYFQKDTVVTDVITEEGGEQWFFFRNDQAGKVTVYMDTVDSTTVDYDLHMFKYNETTGALEEQVSSVYLAGQNENLSKIATPGYYFIAVNSASGFDAANPFAFIVKHSSQYDAAEPDDNAYYAKAKSDKFSVSQTIDNDFDEDWIKYNVTTATNFAVQLTNNGSGAYRTDILDTNLNVLATLNQNTRYNIGFPQGTFFIRVISTTSVSPTQVYTLSSAQTTVPSQISVSRISSDGGVEGYINYGYGSMWRIYRNITVTGQAKTASGTPAYNAPVTIRIIARLNNTVHLGTAITDSYGNFSIPISNITPARGDYSFYASASTHYYDIIPIDGYYGNTRLSMNVSSLYHFAYSMYHPF